MQFDFEGFQANTKAFQHKSIPPMKGHLIALFITIVFAAISFYIGLPAINIRLAGSAYYIIFVLAVFVFLDVILLMKFSKPAKLVAGAGVLLFLFVIVMSFFSSSFFRADAYQSQLKIEETTDFAKKFDMLSLNQVPVIDIEVAKQLGDKKMGQVTALGSQYDVSDQYTLVSVKDKLYRVSPLEHRDLFKWFQNRGKGIPGYIKINVNDPNDVELVELKDGITYSPSAYLQQNLERHVRLSYPTELTTDYSFEINDDGKPFWVVSTYLPQIGLYGGNDATGAIIVDANTGEMKKYTLKDMPSWVDRVQPSEFAIEQLNNWGKYVNGYFNTLFGQKDMLITTEGHNYITINGQTNVFTGVTSVGADRSIVGFSLINLKNKQATFYKVNGADEASAMASAEGEVQNLRYKSTFPIILNIADRPTYFVSLKDQEGLVKKYGFVSLESYNIVGVGDTVLEAQANYIERLKKNGASVNENQTGRKQIKGKITNIQTAIIDGNSNYYITVEGSDKLFVIPIGLSSEVALSIKGQSVSIEYSESKEKTIVANKFDNTDLQY